MECSEIFTTSSEVGPRETFSINPSITYEALLDMYVFMRVEMPIYSSGGLYELAVNDGQCFVERCKSNGVWFEVYRYDNVLISGVATTVLVNSMNMVDMGMADCAEISEIDASLTGFACRVSDVAGIDAAWGYNKSEAGM